MLSELISGSCMALLTSAAHNLLVSIVLFPIALLEAVPLKKRGNIRSALPGGGCGLPTVLAVSFAVRSM